MPDYAAETRKALKDAIDDARACRGSWSGLDRYRIRLSFLEAAQSWLLADQKARMPAVLRHVARSHQYRNSSPFSPLDIHSKADRAHFLADAAVDVALAQGVEIPELDESAIAA